MKPSNGHFFPSQFDDRSPTTRQTLRRLFLMLFLRGHTGANLQKEKLPGSIGEKLLQSLLISAMCGLMAIGLFKYSPFVLAVYLHSMTFTLTGMMLAATTGSVLFNKEESDILLHRPIEMKELLWAKTSVLLEYSLWISLAFNLIGFGVGFLMPNGGLRFVFAHLLSVIMESFFCAGCVVMVYQLCLRWCGRERLENVITWAQVGLTILFVLSSQFLPQIALRGNPDQLVRTYSQWLILIPPAWFAGFDQVISGEYEWQAIVMAILSVAVTLVVVWLAFTRLADEFESGIQQLNEQAGQVAVHDHGRKWIDWFVELVPVKWWLHDPVVRASFILTSVYLTRDRDAKLRIYPAVLPMMMMPFATIFQEHSGDPKPFYGLGLALLGGFLSQLPAMAAATLNHSQQWQASEIFHIAPLTGPGLLCHGARKAIICFMMIPASCVIIGVCAVIEGNVSTLPLLIPGLMMTPINSMLPFLAEKAVPFSQPVLHAKAQVDFVSVFVTLGMSLGVSFIGFATWVTAGFAWFVAIEAIVVLGLTQFLASQVNRRTWPTE